MDSLAFTGGWGKQCQLMRMYDKCYQDSFLSTFDLIKMSFGKVSGAKMEMKWLLPTGHISILELCLEFLLVKLKLRKSGTFTDLNSII